MNEGGVVEQNPSDIITGCYYRDKIMKKPEKKHHYATINNARYDSDEDIYANKMWEEWEAYHNWDIKENYIRKLSTEKIEKAIASVLPNTSLIATKPEYIKMYVENITDAIIKELGGNHAKT